MLPIILLTPLMLAAAPAVINVPDVKYDHRSQTANQRILKATMTSTSSNKTSGHVDSDTDT